MDSLGNNTASVMDVLALKSSTPVIVGGTTIVAWLILSWLLSPKVDANEPPVIKPRIPFIGHIIDLLYYKSDFLKRIYDQSHLPAVTLPMLNGKMYAIFEPGMVQSTLRNPHLSFIPFASEFGKAELLMTDEQDRIIADTDFLPRFFSSMGPALQGKHLLNMNKVAADFMAGRLQAEFESSEWKEIPNFYLWLRDFLTAVTTEGLYGSHNPFRNDKALVEDMWTFEKDLPKLLLNVKPGWIAPAAHQARERLQDALEKYYDAKYDLLPEASQITRVRVGLFREYKFGREGRLELALLHAATANVIPSFFWLSNFIFADEKLVKALREELDAFIERDGNRAIVRLGEVDERCPLLTRCYKESTRLSSVVANNRRVMEDTTITDSNGRTYVLKKGVNLQVSSKTSHRMSNVWGKDSYEFKPDRHLPSELTKEKRSAMHPFGGGKHLCPGRQFAFAELVALMVALVAGHDVESTANRPDGKKWLTPDMGVDSLAGAVPRPDKFGEGTAVRMRRREGWENVEWVYEV